MASGRGYTAKERSGVHQFASAAEAAGVEHIIYLGGLTDPHRRLAAHMRSRMKREKSCAPAACPPPSSARV